MNRDANEIIDMVSNVQNLTESVKDIAETYQNPMIFFQELTSTVSHCIEVYKKEETKQQKIQSETKIIIKKFETQKAMFEEYGAAYELDVPLAICSFIIPIFLANLGLAITFCMP